MEHRIVDLSWRGVDVGRADQRLALVGIAVAVGAPQPRPPKLAPWTYVLERERRIEDELVADQAGRVILGAVIVVRAQQEAALAGQVSLVVDAQHGDLARLLAIIIGGDQDPVSEHQHLVIPARRGVGAAIDVDPVGKAQGRALAAAQIGAEQPPVLEDDEETADLLDDAALVDADGLVVGDFGVAGLAGDAVCCGRRRGFGGRWESHFILDVRFSRAKPLESSKVALEFTRRGEAPQHRPVPCVERRHGESTAEPRHHGDGKKDRRSDHTP
jgi:hypothetical protein